MPTARTLSIPLVLALSACSIQSRCGLDQCRTDAGDAGETGDAGGPSEPGDAAEVSVPVEVEPGRPAARSFVAKIAAGARCPAAPVGWVLAPAPIIASTRVAALMARYCAYDLEPGAGVPAVLPSLRAPAGVIERVVAEPARLLPQAPGAVTGAPLGTGEARHARLREQLGATFKAGASNVDDAVRPYVAIIDTADPEVAWPGAPREQHGLVMGGIVSAIRCPADAASCDRERILYAQAFPSSSSSAGSDAEARGSVWSLNLAVLEALERWRSLSNGEIPLVLNMSVGWEWGVNDTELMMGSRGHLLAGREGSVRSELSPAEEALFLTLSWASCQQVLAIAAAGNTRGGACTQTGPMAPAAWESLPPLSWAQCRDLLDPADRAGLGAEPDHHPNALVYAAGGVDADDLPIVNARPRSAPGRVLYSSMASVPTPAGYTAPWTGTSVATASLSAIAAQYWGSGTNHALRPAQVIAAIDDDSAPVAAGCVAGGAPSRGTATVPRVRAYQVLPKLYEPSSLTFSAPSATLSSAGSEAQPSVTLDPSADGTRTCNGRAITAYSFAGAQSLSGTAWPELTPQPDSPICPLCPLTISNSTGASLRIAVDTAAYSLPTLGSTAVLELHLPQGNVTRIDLDLHNQCSLPSCNLRLDAYSHPSGTSGQTLSDYVVGANVRSARLSFYVATGSNGTQLVGDEIDVFHD
jgi:hypothetical protein